MNADVLDGKLKGMSSGLRVVQGFKYGKTFQNPVILDSEV